MAHTDFVAAIAAFLQVVLIDIALAGDNAVVVGMAAATVPASIRRKVVFWGVVAAVVLRIALAVIVVELLQIVGLTLAGGLLLLWVCWKMFRDLHGQDSPAQSGGLPAQRASRGVFVRAMVKIIVADLSMSLDNVLAVAGAAKDNVFALVAGLAISVILMAVAASLIARLVTRYRFIGHAGVLVVLLVALDMIWRGGHNVFLG